MKLSLNGIYLKREGQDLVIYEEGRYNDLELARIEKLADKAKWIHPDWDAEGVEQDDDIKLKVIELAGKELLKALFDIHRYDFDIEVNY